MNKSRIIFSIFEILLGISMFIYGGYDDSPGGQLLGFIVIIFGIINIIKIKNKYRKNRFSSFAKATDGHSNVF